MRTSKQLLERVSQGESPRELIDSEFPLSTELVFDRWFESLLEDEDLDEGLKSWLLKSRRSADKLVKSIKSGTINAAQTTRDSAVGVGKGLAKEGKQTSRMTKTFFRLLKAKLNYKEGDPVPHKRTVKAAINQLKDVGRVSAVAASFAVPIPGLLVVLEIVARKFGTTIFPSELK